MTRPFMRTHCRNDQLLSNDDGDGDGYENVICAASKVFKLSRAYSMLTNFFGVEF